MPTRSYNQNTLYNGQWNVICDVCGLKFKSNDIYERWDGLRVCKDDWEVRHPMDFQRGFKDDQSVPYTRPDGNSDSTNADGTPVEGTDVSGGTIPATLTITTTSMPSMIVGLPFSVQIETNIVPTPTEVWSIVSGSLPTGLTLNTSTGIVSGTPTASGGYTFTAKIVDGIGRTDTQAYSVTIATGQPASWSQPAGWTNVSLLGAVAQDGSGNSTMPGYIVAMGTLSTEILDIDTLLWSSAAIPSTLNVSVNGGINCYMSNGDFLAIDASAANSETYERSTNTWTPRGAPPRSVAPQWQGGSAAASNGSTYIFGGFEGSGPTSHIQVLNETSGSWTLAAATLPIPLWRHTSVTLNDGRILIGGGKTTSALNHRYWFFDTSLATFTETTSIDAADDREYRMVEAVLPNGEVYLGGGLLAATQIDQTMVFNVDSETWRAGDVSLPVSAAKSFFVYRGIMGSNGDLHIFRIDGFLSPYLSSIT